MRNVRDREPSEGGSRDDVSLHAALEGLRFVFRAPLIRSTMLLDFFATFFSSATALLPIFAQDILHVGARGYGLLYAAPAAGALITSAAMVLLVERIEPSRANAPVGRRRLRPGDRGVRDLTVVLDDVRLPRAHRRERHGQHGHPQHHPAARDAGPAARPHGRRQHGVFHRRTAARRVRSGPGGELARERPSRWSAGASDAWWPRSGSRRRPRRSGTTGNPRTPGCWPSAPGSSQNPSVRVVLICL